MLPPTPSFWDQPRIVVITGVQAAGKSTVGRLLARRFRRGAHVEADVLQQMIVAGAEGVQEPGEPRGEAARQLRLRLKHMCLLGRSFYDAGFTAVLDDIILGDRWQHLQEEMRGYSFSLVVLAPSLDAVWARDETRPKQVLGDAWARYLDHALRTTLAGEGLWIDSTHQSPEETVEQILADLPQPGA